MLGHRQIHVNVLGLGTLRANCSMYEVLGTHRKQLSLEALNCLQWTSQVQLAKSISSPESHDAPLQALRAPSETHFAHCSIWQSPQGANAAALLRDVNPDPSFLPERLLVMYAQR